MVASPLQADQQLWEHNMGGGGSSKGGSEQTYAPPPEDTSEDDAAMMEMMMAMMAGMGGGGMEMPAMPHTPDVEEYQPPPIEKAAKIDWKKKQEELAAKTKADYKGDVANKKGRTSTIHTSPLLDDETNTKQQVLGKTSKTAKTDTDLATTATTTKQPTKGKTTLAG